MVFSIFMPGNLMQIASVINSLDDGPIYFYKDSNNVLGSNSETALLNNSVGYQFNFPDGSSVYSIPPISSITSIPWTYTGTTTLSSLYNSNLVVWIDSKEDKAINNTTQIVMNKAYANNNLFLETTPSYSFTHTTESYIDLSTQACLSMTSLAQSNTWSLAIVCSFNLNNLTDHVVFQHNNIIIKMHQRQTLDLSTTGCFLSLYDDTTFLKGIYVSNFTNTFKYLIYADSSGVFYVSGNTSNFTAPQNMAYNAGNYSVYIGQKSDGTNNSLIKLYELLYWNSVQTINTVTNYLTTRYSLSTYTDTTNVLLLDFFTPVNTPYANALSTSLNCSYNNSNNQLSLTSISKAGGQTSDWSTLGIIKNKYRALTDSGSIFLAIQYKGIPSPSYNISAFQMGFARGDSGHTIGDPTFNSFTSENMYIYNRAGNKIGFRAETLTKLQIIIMPPSGGSTFDFTLTTPIAVDDYLVFTYNITTTQCKIRHYQSSNLTTPVYDSTTINFSSGYNWANQSLFSTTFYPCITIAMDPTCVNIPIKFDPSFTIPGEVNILA